MKPKTPPGAENPRWLIAIFIIVINAAQFTFAEDSTTQPAEVPATAPTTNPSNQQELGSVVVTAEVSRQEIAPKLGANSFTITPAQIQDIPGGDNASFQQVLLRAPGVVEDTFG